MRILCLFFCCMAWSISSSAMTSYADTTICDTIITVNPSDTILIRTSLEVEGYFYYIPCDSSNDIYVTLKRKNVVSVRSVGISAPQYQEEKRIARKKLKQVSFLNFCTFSFMIVGVFTWYPLILIGLLFMIPQLIVTYQTINYLDEKNYLRKERSWARRFYVFLLFGALAFGLIGYFYLLSQYI